MRLLALPGVAIAMLLAGCANLKVTKIPADQRDTHHDHHVKGFRYYLSRPYVVVKSPVRVSEERTLLLVDKKAVETGGLHQALHDDWLKQTQDKGVVQRVDPCTAAVVPVGETELAALRDALVRQAAAAAPEAGGARSRDVRAAAASPAATPAAAVETAAATDADSTAGAATAASSASASTGTGFLPDAALLPGEQVKGLGGNIDIVFLPDMDEQYAVHNKNVFARSSYALNFKDGWQLTGVNGEFDSTAVAIELLKTIDTAIDTAKKVSTAGLDTRARALQRLATGAQGSAANKAVVRLGTSEYLVFEVVRVRIIPPGMYRINKPWEAGGGPAPGCGLLEKLGLNAVEHVTVITPDPQRTIPQEALDGVVYPGEVK